jgi:hypothetical protein
MITLLKIWESWLIYPSSLMLSLMELFQRKEMITSKSIPLEESMTKEKGINSIPSLYD